MNNIWFPDAAYQEGSGGILFNIGNFSLRTYSLTLFFGIIASILTITIFWKRQKYPFEHLMILILITIPSALIGARLWDLVEEAIYKRDTFDFSRWYAIWEGGLSIQGGVVLAFLFDFMYVYSKRDVLDIRKVSSIIIPTVLIGQVIGRWGNYANHELYGKIDWDGSSVLIFGKSFASNMFISDSLSNSYNQIGLYRYPLFLYESLANLVGYILIVWVIGWFGLVKPGINAGIYFIWYGLVRLAMEPLRQNAYDIYIVAAVLFILAGAIAVIYFQWFSRVHYIKYKVRGKKLYRFEYKYAHPEKYVEWINKTRIFRTKRTKEPLVVANLIG
ncbi:Prolipoprotein diacylglyceryl transferase [Mycoplasmopsis meleagridis]|uniref:Phosphatidylglycerol--prolipoprotein diacylglyceryl transferase n=2 Tax=Mycoplasmopsis meleagridis TaxID=29561 RepID=A0A0F5H0M9_9BACT|nr:prolipoprotein diacylglyceryl transferase [Mycoplasmopsis meleagridis]KKB26758.1 Prolipoprotein diacylglyceryl transferase [Mycoplasmopsis meleagridis ATCC 25294]KUH47544.1 prolipoprotein diacylglyceryl transferase [Mycoplasmopsis meleagridis]OAD18126.1 Prolipoprotein diacylglyceryl transferase [Mycoplasmopsis meleagridis]VEU77292.1 Prolipoprotein diacylglyceryl transferase [Mycoplasmopsis meleagridis]